MLAQWTDWHTRDMFGWPQPSLEGVVGQHGRSKLSGQERPHDYQVRVTSHSQSQCILRDTLEQGNLHAAMPHHHTTTSTS